MVKILFLIHDLGQGGAEKVLVNLVNNMDHEKFDITVVALFGGGVNEQFLSDKVRFRAVWPKEIPGNSHIMKLLSPKQLHRICVKEHYDIEVSYLEGPSARVISGCTDPDTKLVSWIHSTIKTEKEAAASFRSSAEARKCYDRMDMSVFVANGVRDAFCKALNFRRPRTVLYNTTESNVIAEKAREGCFEGDDSDGFRLVTVGTLKQVKGYDRLLRIMKRLLTEGYPVKLYMLGKGPMQKELEEIIETDAMQDSVILLGYDTNPYKYVSKCDLFICSSYSEGFSTAATEALIVGTPVCTVDVSGMKEMLGECNEYGLVTENTEEALYIGIKQLLDDPALLALFREKAKERGRRFSTEETVKATEDMLLSLVEER